MNDATNAAILPLLCDFLMEDDICLTEPVSCGVAVAGMDSALTLPAVTRRNEKPRCQGYLADVVPRYNLDDFRSVFRLGRVMCETLIVLIGLQLASYTESHHGGRAGMSVETTVLVALYYLGSQETIRKVADKFAISESSVLKARDRFVDVLLTLQSSIIKWPQVSICFVCHNKRRHARTYAHAGAHRHAQAHADTRRHTQAH